MSVCTKTGDSGMTDGPSGRVLKDSAFCEVVGTLDELNAAIGMAVGDLFNLEVGKHLIAIQNQLLDIGAQLYTGKVYINDGDVQYLERLIDQYEEPLEGFIIPEGRTSGTLHLARAIARRVERQMLAATGPGVQIDHDTLKYINRLSDVLYILAIHIGPVKPRYWNGTAA